MTASDPLAIVCEALRTARCDPKRVGRGRGYSFKCPLHDDQKASGSLNPSDDGSALVYCHVCGKRSKKTQYASELVNRIGLQLRDLFPHNGQHHGNGQVRRIVARYDYRDERGALLFQVVCFRPKAFAQCRPDGNGGETWKLGTVRRVPYHLPAIANGPAEAIIFAVEGEKDADRLAKAGLIATCCPGGVGKWGRVDDAALEGRRVVVIPDSDDAGRQHAQDVARRLYGRVESLRILELPGLPEHGDVSDWLDAGGDAEALDRLAATTPDWEPRTELAAPAFSNGAESMAAVNAMATTGRELRAGAARLCDQVAQWFDRRGPGTLGKQFPISYAARAVGVSRPHFHRLAQLGRVRQVLRARNTAVDEVPDRALLPLLPLLDRPDDVQDTFARAREEERKAEAERKKSRETGGNPLPRKQLATLVREAASPLRPAGGKREPARPPQPVPRPANEVWQAVADAYHAARRTSGVPEEALELLTRVLEIVQPWAEGR